MNKDQISVETLQEVMQPIYDHVHQDGGNLEILEITADRVVKVRLMNACANCKLSKLMLKEGMLRIIQKQIPEIQDVEVINE